MFKKGSPVRFVTIFLSLFLVFYFFNIFFFGITSPGNYYNRFIDEHFNYISLLRHFLLYSSKSLLNLMGFAAITNDTDLLVAGKGTLKLIYSCLGLGVMSFFSAFVLAYPKKIRQKVWFLVVGIVVIQLLNVLRFVVLAIFWNKKEDEQIIDHHTVFNIIIYVIIIVSLYFWIKRDDKQLAGDAKN